MPFPLLSTLPPVFLVLSLVFPSSFPCLSPSVLPQNRLVKTLHLFHHSIFLKTLVFLRLLRSPSLLFFFLFLVLFSFFLHHSSFLVPSSRHLSRWRFSPPPSSFSFERSSCAIHLTCFLPPGPPQEVLIRKLSCAMLTLPSSSNSTSFSHVTLAHMLSLSPFKNAAR